ncbi:MAG: antirestriction protein ArdA [Bacteroidales bacterium]|nr:antirestriction protein ArdA [Bacteroidales bacterium]
MIRVYLTNLGMYNNGVLCGEWVDLPCDDFDAVFDRIKVCHGEKKFFDSCGNPYEEYFITDYETSFGLEIHEYENLERLNDLAESLKDIDDEIIETLLYFGVEWDDIPREADNVNVYADCKDMTDVAYEVVEQSGILAQIPENLQNYFDYEAYGRDLNIEGNFYYTNGNYYEYVG